jgi:hypothetical protein
MMIGIAGGTVLVFLGIRAEVLVMRRPNFTATQWTVQWAGSILLWGEVIT